MTKGEFQTLLKDAVKGAFDGLSDESKLDKLGQLVETAESTIKELVEAVDSKDSELAKSGEEKTVLQEQVEQLVAKNKELEEQLAAREAQLKDLDEKRVSAEQRATAAESVLAEAAAVRALDARVAELAEAKVLKSGDKLDLQKTKIAAMSDEEFAAYKEDLVDVRSEVEAAIKEKAAVVEEEGETVEVAPPDIRVEEASVAGALNAESDNTSTLSSKYKDFSSALAKKMRNV